MEDQEFEGESQEGYFIPEEIQMYLDQLRLVGPGKPIGYLAIWTLVGICSVTPDVLSEELSKKGLTTMQLSFDQCNIPSGAFIAYHPTALNSLLQQNLNILLTNGWPTTPHEFVMHSFFHQAPPKTELYNLVADAYNNKNDPDRL